jgi:hypothetical protein
MCRAYFTGCKIKVLPYFDIENIPKMEKRESPDGKEAF